MVFTLLFILIAGSDAAQSRKEGVRLVGEGDNLNQAVRSCQDLEGALAKYREALHIFKEVRDLRGDAYTLNLMAWSILAGVNTGRQWIV